MHPTPVCNFLMEKKSRFVENIVENVSKILADDLVILLKLVKASGKVPGNFFLF